MKRLRRSKGTIRGRIAAAMVALTALALVISGGIVAVVQKGNADNTITEQLKLIRSELRVLATEGVDPETGQRFTDPSRVLHTFLARTVTGRGEGEVAFVGDRLTWTASLDVELRLEQDDELMAYAAQHALDNESPIETVRTSKGEYRVLVAPVLFPNERGALVHAVDLSVTNRELRNLMTLYFAVAMLTVVVVVFIAWLSVGRLLRPVHELRVAAESINERDLTSRVPVGEDEGELSALTVTINRMLDRVQRSVEAQQRLLDDVGHELRTPITVVRGHMELIDPDDPADVAQTRDLVVDEMDRMGVLVNDLLMLAKANQDDFIKPQRYDLARLTDQVLEKARTLGERSWRLERVAEAEAYIDPARITQAWLQLAANAVKYSQPGSPITLGSRVNGGYAELWVRDQGIGIARDELATVRKRFGRGQRAAHLAQGSGLGLSIVDSIVSAHRGQLDIESVEGEGSTFTLVLPLNP